ncbi:MAG: adenylate/guanylate cyclase domain-containing protein [Pseudomonadota bacterium]
MNEIIKSRETPEPHLDSNTPMAFKAAGTADAVAQPKTPPSGLWPKVHRRMRATVGLGSTLESAAQDAPQRVKEAIRESDDLSEVLVKIIQLVVFALWGLAYFAAPPPDPSTESRVPIVIGAYMAVTIVLLILALRRWTPPWLIYTSIVLDTALLTYLIFTFHQQYGQPASFSLKAVEVLNYFVLIALRTLRFEARYVLATGAASMGFWALLVVYVVVNDPADPMVTRSYVTYLTSNTVLIGAEMSKLISMAMVTAILAIAVSRANNYVSDAIAETQAATDLSRFLPISVAHRIRHAETVIKAGEGERRHAAILNIDIRQFTRIVETLRPAAMMRLLGDYQQRLIPIINAHSGTIDKFMGDGIMITFGATEDLARPDKAALDCMRAIVRDIGSWDGAAGSLEVNLAASSGAVVVGAVGDESRLEFTVVGPAVNLSAKLEKHNKMLSSKALVTGKLFDDAVAQGFEPDGKEQRLSVFIEGTGEQVEIVILA